MRVPSARTALSASLVTAMIFIVGIAGCRVMDRNNVAVILNITQVPASVSEIDCASIGFTDVLQRCTFNISPADFNLLLVGYRYLEPSVCLSGSPVGVPCLDPETIPQSSHTFCCGPELGPDFPIAHTFTASPREFEHGGNVTVLTDRSQSLVMVDLYIE